MRKGFRKGITRLIPSEISDKVRLYSQQVITYSEGLEVGRELVIN
jgi:hypothetical protein